MYKDFDKNIRGFFKFLSKVADESPNQVIGDDLDFFVAEYEKKGPTKDLFASFKKIFNNYTDDIVNNGCKWIESEKHVIELGKKGKIHLTEIYRICVQVSNVYEEKLKEFPKETKIKYHQIYYPKIFFLHMYRIFLDFADNGNKEKLQKNIQEIESVLKDQPQPQEALSVQNALQNVNISQMISQIMNNDDTKNLLSSLINKINVEDCDNMESLLQQILRTTTDPELLQNFEKIFKNALKVTEQQKPKG
jgi:hypothetical protein